MTAWIEPDIDRRVKKRLQKYKGPWIFGYPAAFVSAWRPKTKEEFLEKYFDSGLEREMRIKKCPEDVQRILQNPDASPAESRGLNYAWRDFNFMRGRTRDFFEKICGDTESVDWFLWHGLAGAWNNYARGL